MPRQLKSDDLTGLCRRVAWDGNCKGKRENTSPEPKKKCTVVQTSACKRFSHQHHAPQSSPSRDAASQAPAKLLYSYFIMADGHPGDSKTT